MATAVLMTSMVGLTGVAQANSSERAASFAQTGQSVAAPTTSIAAEPECGILRCSYVFSKKNTNTIADDGLAAVGLCAVIPPPGNGFCAGAFAVAIVTAKVAKGQGECLTFNWLRATPNLGLFATGGGSRCK